MSQDTSRIIYSYNRHLMFVDYFLSDNKTLEKRDHIFATSSIVFSAFSIEAFLNHVGEQLFDCWLDNLKRSLNTEAKLSLISEKIDLDLDFGKSPYQSFRTAFRFRNCMAHASTEKLSEEKAKHYLQVGNKKWPAAEWEKLCTTEVAQKISNDIREIIALIEKYAGIEPIPAFLTSEFQEWTE